MPYVLCLTPALGLHRPSAGVRFKSIIAIDYSVCTGNRDAKTFGFRSAVWYPDVGQAIVYVDNGPSAQFAEGRKPRLTPLG